MRFEPNLSMIFTELPLVERPAAAAAAGFEAAELWWPFAEPVPDETRIDELAEAFESAGIGLACLNTFGGDLSNGDRGILSVPGRAQEFSDNLAVAVELAGRLGCRTINTLYGRHWPGSTEDLDEHLAIESLRLAVRAADAIGARVIVEAINPVDIPGYGLPTVTAAVAFLDKARDAGVEAWLSFDVYHAAMAGESLDGLIDRYVDRIGHVQLADVPGRHEPGSGDIDFAGMLGRLEDGGYDGWVGLEYAPSMDSAQSLRRSMAALALTADHGVGP
jgi:hydroxypyruvate isomerase